METNINANKQIEKQMHAEKIAKKHHPIKVNDRTINILTTINTDEDNYTKRK